MAQASRILRPATIANSASLSDAVDLDWRAVVALDFDAAFDGASVTFQAANASDETYGDLYDSGGTEVTMVVSASRRVIPTAAHALALLGHRFLKVRAGTAGSPNAQTGASVITLVLDDD
jgi:hypothetical protein